MQISNLTPTIKLNTTQESVAKNKDSILYKEPDNYTPVTFNEFPKTPVENFTQTASHAERYAKQLSELYFTLLDGAIRQHDSQVASRFTGLINELVLMASVTADRAKKVMEIEREKNEERKN